MDIANGYLLNVQTKARLSPWQMMSIANTSAWSGWSAVAIEWAEAAKALDDELVGVDDFLKQARLYHDSVWKASNGSEGIIPNVQMFLSKTLNEDGSFHTARELRKQEFHFFQNEQLDNGNLSIVVHNFYELCRGKYLKGFYYMNQKCSLTDVGDPYFFLAPLKKETLSSDPHVYLLHDIVTDAEIEDMINVDIEDMAVSDYYALCYLKSSAAIAALF